MWLDKEQGTGETEGILLKLLKVRIKYYTLYFKRNGQIATTSLLHRIYLKTLGEHNSQMSSSSGRSKGN